MTSKDKRGLEGMNPHAFLYMCLLSGCAVILSVLALILGGWERWEVVGAFLLSVGLTAGWLLLYRHYRD